MRNEYIMTYVVQSYLVNTQQLIKYLQFHMARRHKIFLVVNS